MRDAVKDDEVKAVLLKAIDEDTDGFVNMILTESRLIERFNAMDSRELLWWMLHSPMFKNAPVVGPWGAMCGALENKLYPEYDGENITVTDLGWNTPEGEINYVKEPLP